MFLRKIPTIFLAVVMMISVLTVFPVSAEEARIMMLEVEAETNASTLSTSPVIYNAGDEIKISVRVSQNTGITGLMLYMEYDEKALEAVEDKCSAMGLLTADDFLNHYVSKSGDAYFTFFSESNSTVTNATGVLAELTFIAKEVCAVDTAVEVTLFQNNPGFCVSGGDEVPFVSESGRFSIHGINADEGLVTAPPPARRAALRRMSARHAARPWSATIRRRSAIGRVRRLRKTVWSRPAQRTARMTAWCTARSAKARFPERP